MDDEKNDCTAMPPHVVCYYLDGHVHGNEAKALRGFADSDGKTLVKDKQTLYISKTEESVKKSKGYTRGPHNVDAVEYCVIITKPGGEEKPAKPRLHFPLMSTSSNILGPFVLPHRHTMGIMQVEHCKKPLLLGTAFERVGGPAGNDQKHPAPKASEIVPMAWHPNDPRLYEELGHADDVVGWVDLTPLDGALAFYSVQHKKPYLGFGYTKEHCDILAKHLVSKVFHAFADPTDPLYEATFTIIVIHSTIQLS